MNYSAPKTKINLHLGRPRHSRWRSGWFKIEPVNNQYNSHHYWVSFSQDDKSRLWHFSVWNPQSQAHDWVHKRIADFEKNIFNHKCEIGYKTEQDAADALNAFAIKMHKYYLQQLSEDLKKQQNSLQKQLTSLA